MTGLASQLADLAGFHSDEPRDRRGRWMTLYRGEGSHDRPSHYPKGSSDTGAWWTSSLVSARRYAAGEKGDVYQVEVERHEAEPHGLPGYYLIKNPAVRARRRLIASYADLASQLEAIELAFDPHELRIPKGQPRAGEWVHTPADKPGTGIHRYVVPDPERLVIPPPKKPRKNYYVRPEDQPFFQAHPLSVANILKAYDAADEGTRAQGRDWYRQNHEVAKIIGGGNAEEGAILLSAYTAQKPWPYNMFQAMKSFNRGKALGPGEGMAITGDNQKTAQAALDGAGIDEALAGPKTHSFAVLLAQGDDSPDDPYGHVVIDTHALNVAAGGTVRGDEGKKAPIGGPRYHQYVADLYREAARQVSEREGVLMKPHQLQAITWMVQQQASQAEDAAAAASGRLTKGELGRARGRVNMTKNAWKVWMAYAKKHNVQLVPGLSSLAGQAALAQLIELASDGSLLAQLLSGPVRTVDGVELHDRLQADLATSCPGCGCLTAQLLEPPPFTGSGLATDLAAWTHERRVPKGLPGGGQWVKGAVMPRGAPPMGVFRDPDPAWKDTPWIVRMADGTEVHVTDEGAAKVRKLLPAVAGEQQRARSGNLVLPDGTRMVHDPSSSRPGWSWRMISPSGQESWVGRKDAERLFPQLKQPSPPGVETAPGVKQYLLPGMPEPSREYGHRSPPVEALRKLEPEVDRALVPGYGPRVHFPEQGAQGAVAVVELDDGTKVVTKSQNEIRNDREELGYYVSQVVGAGAPPVVRSPSNPRDIIEGYVPGKTLIRYMQEQTGEGGDWTGYDPEEVASEIEISAAGGTIGLLDYLTGNPDRHEANVMVDQNGNPTPIDHGMAFEEDWTSSPFWEGGSGEAPGGWSADDVAAQRAELMKIEPEFARLGHLDWFQSMLDRVDLLQEGS